VEAFVVDVSVNLPFRWVGSHGEACG
jgi:hypothetical protein